MDNKLTEWNEGQQTVTKKMNVFERVFGVFFSPGEVMQNLAEKPRIILGLIISLIVPAVTLLAVFPMYKEFSRPVIEATYKNMNLPSTPEDIDAALEIAKITGPIGGAVGSALMWFVGALVLWLILKIFKGQGTLKQFLSVTGYASVVSVISAIVFIAITQVTGTYASVSYTSLAVILPESLKGSFVYGVASGIEVFSIWQYILIAIGAVTVSKISKNKVYIVVACIFAILLIYAGVQTVQAAALLN